MSERSAAELLAEIQRTLAGNETGPAPEPAWAERDSGAPRSVEDLVRDLLRPMIERWLDQNLEGLVARVVHEELARSIRLSDETDTENFAATIVSLVRHRRRQ